MSFNIDSFIFVTFLVVNLVFGLWSSRGIKTIKEYAVGDGSFDTATIAATIIATWISGSFFFNRLSESYTNGLYFMWAALGTTFELIIVGVIFAPRMSEFLGKISIAEAMGDMYGNKVRIITSVSGFIGTVGYIAVQFKVAGSLFEYSFGIDNIYGVFISAIIVTTYSSLGGIKSVTLTDVIQLITFGTVIPTIAFFILSHIDNLDVVLNMLKTNESFNYMEVFDFTNPKSFYYLFLFLYMATPIFNPPIFQRISMAKNAAQASRSFVIAGLGCLFLTMIVFWISTLVLSINPSLNPSDIVKYILSEYSYAGLKGLTLAGIMAMVMSTADSYVNSTAVIFVHDFCKPLGLKLALNELVASRIASFALGVLGLILAIKGQSILDIVITTYSFYMPIVTVPFILGVIGFRSSGKSVLIGMVAGFVVAIIWFVFDITFIDAIVPGMVCNFIALIASHHALNQPGGWVSSTSTKTYSRIKSNQTPRRNLFNFNIWHSLLELLRNSTPSRDSIYVSTGLFCMIMIYSTMHSLPKDLQESYSSLIERIIPLSLFLATALLSYPLWFPNWKRGFVSVAVWNIVVFTVLICCGFIFLMISNFSQVQLMIFMINLVILASILRWKLAIFMILLGFAISSQLLGALSDQHLTIGSDFKMIYLLLLLSSVWVVFLKPQQDYQELTEERNKHLNVRIIAKEKEVQEALALKGEFIRNVQHEYHTPMTGIISLSEGMLYAYDKLTDEEKREYLKDIVQNSHKLQTFDENITTLSLLSKPHYKLEREDIALNDLIYERVQICRKLYDQDNDDREFALDLEDNVVVSADKSYIIQLLDNLLINAIQYCKKGLIRVTLSDDKINAVFTVSDEGIGIPKLELFEIFDPFTVSSKTRTPSGGRGVGLAVCRRIAEVHGGEITAESDGKKGAKFTVKLPLHKR